MTDEPSIDEVFPDPVIIKLKKGRKPLHLDEISVLEFMRIAKKAKTPLNQVLVKFADDPMAFVEPIIDSVWDLCLNKKDYKNVDDLMGGITMTSAFGIIGGIKSQIESSLPELTALIMGASKDESDGGGPDDPKNG